MRLPYREGDVFAVPLLDGGFALGVVARVGPNGPIPLGYFFGPKIQQVPSSEAIALNPAEALRIWRFGDLHLMDGRWPVVSRVKDWRREDWPMPKFIREEPIRGMTWLVTYSDSDPGVGVSNERCGREKLDDHEKDLLRGAGVVEIKLTKLLSGT